MDVEAPPRVVIADDHAPTRWSLRRVLEDDGIVVAGEVDDAEQAVAVCRSLSPDVAILDVRMPGNGVRAAEIIKADCPWIEVMMLTISDDDVDLLATLAAGASGYWLKGQDLELIPKLVRRIILGDTVLSSTLVKPVVKELRGRRTGPDVIGDAFPGVRFSPREREVIELLADGCTTAQIGDRLFIADVTVRTHIAAIVKKLRVRDRNEIVERLRSAASARP